MSKSLIEIGLEMLISDEGNSRKEFRATEFLDAININVVKERTRRASKRKQLRTFKRGSRGKETH